MARGLTVNEANVRQAFYEAGHPIVSASIKPPKSRSKSGVCVMFTLESGLCGRLDLEFNNLPKEDHLRRHLVSRAVVAARRAMHQ